jgi:hypothetical protein
VEQIIKGLVINNMIEGVKQWQGVQNKKIFLSPHGINQNISYWVFIAMKEQNKFHLPKQYNEDD